jgi:MFS transporter, DHA1 family, multidrug resistance protein
MAHILRETAFGQIARLLSGNRLFPYPEERSGFVLPGQYTTQDQDIEKAIEKRSYKKSTPVPDSQTIVDEQSSQDESGIEDGLALDRTVTSTARSQPYTEARFEAEHQLELGKTKSIPIVPQRTADGIVLVDWYTTDDEDNPQNWPRGWKAFVVSQS